MPGDIEFCVALSGKYSSNIPNNIKDLKPVERTKTSVELNWPEQIFFGEIHFNSDVLPVIANNLPFVISEPDRSSILNYFDITIRLQIVTELTDQWLFVIEVLEVLRSHNN